MRINELMGAIYVSCVDFSEGAVDETDEEQEMEEDGNHARTNTIAKTTTTTTTKTALNCFVSKVIAGQELKE